MFVYILFFMQTCVRTDFVVFRKFVFWWLVRRVNRRQTEVSFQPWCNPLWMTGLKVPTNWLTVFCLPQSCQSQQANENTGAKRSRICRSQDEDFRSRWGRARSRFKRQQFCRHGELCRACVRNVCRDGDRPFPGWKLWVSLPTKNLSLHSPIRFASLNLTRLMGLSFAF